MEPPRILIADDDAGIRDALKDLLGDEKMDVVGSASDGAEAVAMAAELHPDVVLMDLRMPEVDGIRATRSIKEQDDFIQIIILSAYDDPGLNRGADEAGAYAYLVKGCSAALVRDMIMKAYNLKKGLEARGAREAPA